MSVTEQQLLNYLHWLKDRGQTFASFAELSPPRKETAETFDTPPEKAAPVKTPAREKLRLLFVTSQPLLENEAEMILRIAAAIGARSDSFRIVLKEALPDFDPDFVVALGDALSPDDKTLLIPHPSEMMKDPSLKVSAWEKLQKLKAQL